MKDSTQFNKPQHIMFLEQLLKKQGVHFYEKNVSNQLLEFMNYYTSEVVNEAQVNRRYRLRQPPSDKETSHLITNADLKLAIKFKTLNSFTKPISSSHIQRIAQEKNNIPLNELVLGKQNLKAAQRSNKDVQEDTPEYSKMLQEMSKQANLNGLP